jgi:enterochelin esterase-like enzyme
LTHSEDRGEPGYRRFKMGRRGGGQKSETTQWVNEPENRQGSEGVKHFQFDSKALGQPVGYSIYLPKSYDKSGQRYPVIYWLHGKNGNESRGAHIAAYLQSAVDKHLIKEAIMVFPNGGVDSFYSDSYDGKIKVESMLINELIPLIDSTYRTVAARNGRVLEGFSMGGFGALKFMCKYPDKFLSVATFGAALLDRVNPPQRRDAHAYQVMFNDNIDTFDKNTPAYWCEHNRDLLKKLNTKIRIVAGGSDGTRRYNERMHQLLTDLSIEHDYQVLAGVKHIPKQYYDEYAGGSFAFHGLVLGK